MTVFHRAGRHMTPFIGWETLCSDVRPLILGKLNLRDLARAAGTCREFQQTCHSHAAEECAALIAAREEADGKLFFPKFVAALRRAMFGFRPSPGLLCDSTDSEEPTSRTPPVNRFADPEFNAWISTGRESGKLFAVIPRLPDQGAGNVFPWLPGHGEEKVFNARLYGTNGDSLTYWKMSRSGGEDLRLHIEGHNMHAKMAVAILAAACLQDREGAPTPCQSPLTVRCALNVCSVGALSVRELGDLVAPLRYRAESVTVTAYDADVAPPRGGMLNRGYPFRGFIVDIRNL
jgi:hypothetical protein